MRTFVCTKCGKAWTTNRSNSSLVKFWQGTSKKSQKVVLTWLLWKRGSWHLYKYVVVSNLFQVFGIHVDFHESRSFCWWKTPRKKPVDISTQTIIPQPSTNQWLTMEKKLQSISISFGNHHHSPMIGKRQLPKNFRITFWCWEKSPPSMWRCYTFGHVAI